MNLRERLEEKLTEQLATAVQEEILGRIDFDRVVEEVVEQLINHSQGGHRTFMDEACDNLHDSIVEYLAEGIDVSEVVMNIDVEDLLSSTDRTVCLGG